MIKCFAQKKDGCKQEIFGLVSLQINKDEDAPADSLKLVVNDEITERYTEISVVKDMVTSIFKGIVDEQIISVSEKGHETVFVCRSREAILLDNEACPHNFINPTLGVLVKIYAEPLGFYLKQDNDFSIMGEYSVTKGMSCWQAIDEFCRKYKNHTIKIENSSCICFEVESSADILFAEAKSFSIKKNYSKQISGVYRQTNKSGGYDSFFKNESASGIARIRYQSAQCKISPQEFILNGEREALSARCLLNGLQMCKCGSNVRLPQITLKNEWHIDGVRYNVLPQEESTLLILR